MNSTTDYDNGVYLSEINIGDFETFLGENQHFFNIIFFLFSNNIR